MYDGTIAARFLRRQEGEVVAGALPNHPRVLISGAGIAGLTLAVLLKERGLEPLVVERDPGIRAHGYMMDFFGSGWDVAERMGLANDIRGVKYPIERIEFVDSTGTPYVSVPIDRIRKALGGKYVYLRHSDLQSILHERAMRAKVDIRFGTTVVALDPTDDAVEARLSTGKTEPFDLVFGADGLHSAIRKLAFGEEDAYSFHLGGYVAAFHIAQSPLELDNAFKLQEATDRVAAYYPLGGGELDATLVFRHPDFGHVSPDRGLSLLREKWSEPGWIGSSLLEELTAWPPVFFDTLAQIRMPNWHYGRIALVGDACGCLTLLAGQGSHMAMAGAYVLATELARHDDYEAAFRAYETLMAPTVMKRQIETERFAKIIMPTDRSQPRLRRVGTRLLFSPPGLRFGLRLIGARSVLEGYP